MSRETGRFQPYGDDPAACRAPAVAALHDYWRGLCRDGLLPSREAVDPAAIKPLLPHVLIMDVEQAPLRVRYRLVGTAVAELSRRDITGHYLDELEFDGDWERAAFEAGYRRMLERRAPVFGRLLWLALDDLTLIYESAIFPLAGDGRTIDKAIAIEHYLDADRREIAARVPPRPTRARE